MNTNFAVKEKNTVVIAKHLFTILFFLLVCQLVQSQAPVINNFTPASGPPGTIVTITGSNFDATPANNIIYFGAVRGNVLTATGTSITVGVPIGATYQPVTLTVSGLTGSAKKPFVTTFVSGTSVFTSNSFETGVPFNANDVLSDIAITDFDGDGKPDVVTSSISAKCFKIFKNTGSAGAISFSPVIRLGNFITDNTYNFSVADLDGDGKRDLIVTNGGSNSFSVFRNTSSPGSISFSAISTFQRGRWCEFLAIGDLDNDGKPDIALTDRYSPVISILQNTGSPGTISFTSPIDFTPGIYLRRLLIKDIDDDGNADLAGIAATSPDKVISILKNITAGSTISFAPPVSYPANGTLNYYSEDNLFAGDLDGDDKADLAVTNSINGTISVLRNTSTIGTVSLAPRVNFSTGLTPVDITFTDMDGDGKPDISVANYSSRLSVFKNNCTPGNISFAGTDYNVSAEYFSKGISNADFDGDGKPDIALAAQINNSINVFKNNIAQPVIDSFSPTSASAGNLITVKGSNFNTIGSVSLGGIFATSFTIISDSVITLVAGQGYSGNLVVNSSTGASASMGGFVFTGPAISTFAPASASPGMGVTIKGINFTNTSSLKFGITPASSFTVLSDTVINAITGLGSSGSISLTTPTATTTKGGFTFIPTPVIFSFTPTAAGISAQLDIRGKYFAGTTAVKIGGVAAASFSVISDTLIKAITAATTTGAVSVTSSYGTATLSGFTFLPVPSISSFAPLSAPAGATLVISGLNFSNTPSDHTVYFGAVKAVVTASTTTTLTVLVPAGAKYAPITVTLNGLTASSPKLFMLTFTSGPITTKSFINKDNYFLKKGVDNVVTQDFDGDGKPDVVAADDSLMVFRNTSIVKNISFATGISFGGISGYTIKVAVGDIDGDGKTDIAAGSQFNYANRLSIFKNTSSAGSISFDRTNIPTPNFLEHVTIADIDGDGRPDIIANTYGPTLYVFRNTTVNGIVSFASPLMYTLTGSNDYNLCVADFDGDGKVDVVTSTGSDGRLVLLRNTSIPGTITFAPNFWIPVPGYATFSSVSDIDGDGKQDIVVSYNNRLSIYKNASVPGSFSFPSRFDFAQEGTSFKFSVVDVDGDSKQDIVTLDGYANLVNVFKNTSTPGNISVSAAVSNGTEYNLYDIDACDIDGDGRPDILMVYDLLTVLRNVITEPVINSFSPLSASVGGTVIIKGFSFNGTSAVNFSGIPAASFSVLSDSIISATLAATPQGNVSVTNAAGTGTLDDQFPVPDISSFTPQFGPAGTQVLIKGHNFNLSMNDNIVQFGSVKAPVISATDSTIVVNVPRGAVNDNITLTTHKLVAFTAKPFEITFKGGDSAFNPVSFDQRMDYATSRAPETIIVNDLNGDGKPDITVSTTYYCTIFKNTADSGSLSLVPFADSSTNQYRFILKDLDGDGKSDKILPSPSGNVTTLSFYRNKSSTSAFAFDRQIIVKNTAPYLQSYFYSLPVVADMNGDGKPEIISGNNNAAGSTLGTIMVLQNKSAANILSFAPVTGFSTGTSAGLMRKADLDGDGLPDIITLKNSYSHGFAVLRNTGGGFNISLAPYQEFSVPSTCWDFYIGDLDRDGKPDVVITNFYANTFSVFRNTSIPGTISFAPKIDFVTGNAPYGIVTGDMNSDNRQDVVVTNSADSTVSVFRNISTPGTILFAPRINYRTGQEPRNVILGDMDLDGKMDIVTANYTSNTISVLRNRQGEKPVAELCDPVGNTSLTSHFTGTIYQWQISTDSINFYNIGDSLNYTGTKTVMLNLFNIPSAWYGYQYRCLVDGAPAVVTTIKFKNRWIGTVSNEWENPANWSCGTVPDLNTDVNIQSGSVLISTNTTVRSLAIGAGASLTVAPGVILTITH